MKKKIWDGRIITESIIFKSQHTRIQKKNTNRSDLNNEFYNNNNDD